MSPAEFVLNAATAAGYRFETDGDELLVVPPRGLPKESWRSFQRAIFDHRIEIMEFIVRENTR